MRKVYANKSHNKLNAVLFFSLHVDFVTILLQVHSTHFFSFHTKYSRAERQIGIFNRNKVKAFFPHQIGPKKL